MFNISASNRRLYWLGEIPETVLTFVSEVAVFHECTAPDTTPNHRPECSKTKTLSIPVAISVEGILDCPRETSGFVIYCVIISVTLIYIFGMDVSIYFDITKMFDVSKVLCVCIVWLLRSTTLCTSNPFHTSRSSRWQRLRVRAQH